MREVINCRVSTIESYDGELRETMKNMSVGEAEQYVDDKKSIDMRREGDDAEWSYAKEVTGISWMYEQGTYRREILVLFIYGEEQ